MHASHIKKLQPNFQSLLLNFKICNFVIKKFFSKKIKSVFNENTNQFLFLENHI